MVAIFWIGRKPRCEVSMAPAFQTVRTALEGLTSKVATFSLLEEISARTFAVWRALIGRDRLFFGDG
jgi:hypothetical protein